MSLVAKNNIKIGSDICSVERIKLTYEKYGERLLNKILTQNEKAYVLSKSSMQSKHQSQRIAEALAARFAAKEAIVKALGTGWRGIHWHEVEISNAESGAPQVILHARAKQILQRLTLSEIKVSLSHERSYALATVIIY